MTTRKRDGKDEKAEDAGGDCPQPYYRLTLQTMNNKSQQFSASRGGIEHVTTLLVHSLFLALIAVACRSRNEFRNTSRDDAHAVLRGGGHVLVGHINGQPTSFWRFEETFRIPTGTNEVRAAYSDRKKTFGFRSLQFVAQAGGGYLLTRRQDRDLVLPVSAVPHPTTSNAWVIWDRRDRVTVEQTGTNGTRGVVADAPREDYVFGVSSSDAAIVEYRRKNP